jgi:glycosyltransferase involved in cell wall biosynthesis
VAVCDVVRDALVGLGFPTARIARVYNGIDVAAFRAPPSAGIRAQFGWPDDTKVVGMVANVRVTKGYEYFVRAARQVLDADPSVRFVSAGDVDPVLGEPVLRLVRELQLEGAVRFLGQRSDVPALMRDLDVFVLPSTSEGFPLALLEAMAAGKAVVATRCGGPEELVQDGANGFLVPPADPGSLSDRIVRLLTDDVRARALGNKARETGQRFTVASMVANYQDVYQQVLQAS